MGILACDLLSQTTQWLKKLLPLHPQPNYPPKTADLGEMYKFIDLTSWAVSRGGDTGGNAGGNHSALNSVEVVVVSCPVEDDKDKLETAAASRRHSAPTVSSRPVGLNNWYRDERTLEMTK